VTAGDDAGGGAWIECRRLSRVYRRGASEVVPLRDLDLDIARMAHLLVPIRNCSIHRVMVLPEAQILSGFNATPHLDTPDRLHARTEY
jgi:hypothetical protein